MRQMLRVRFLSVVVLLFALLLSACTNTATTPEGNGSAEAANLLEEVRQRGRLLISTDSNYAPQSFKNPDGSWEGFDIDVATEVARRIGVEAEFLDIDFDVITAGSWNNRWDVNIGSMTITEGRKEVLIFTAPYYYAPASFVVHQDSAATDVSALEGLAIGVGAGTTYLDYLSNELVLTDEEIRIPAPTAESRIYSTDALAIDDLSLGDGTRLNAVLTALPTAQEAISNGRPLRILGDPVYYEALAVALDRTSALDAQPLADEITRVLEEMRADGTLRAISERYYGVDVTSKVE